jgi:glycosyltransferase involved in cell wall biosynthesis
MASEMVVIGVVPRDRLSTFPRCLEALYAHTASPFRVVLVAGGADHATRQHLQTLQAQYANLSVVLVDRLLEQATARNLVLRHVHERCCVLIENDTLVHPGWLHPLLECMRDERAAVVTPLLLDFWEGTIHTAGGAFQEGARDGAVTFHHESMYPRMLPVHAPLQRTRIAYAEAHCLLIDRQQLPDPSLFDDVEPFDVDLGLTLRNRGLTAFLEPRSRATYLTPPPLQVGDIAAFKFRWDAEAWAARNRRFQYKWHVTYDGSGKQRFYRRQHRKLGLARWYPNRSTVWMFNTYLGGLKCLRSQVRRWRYAFPVAMVPWPMLWHNPFLGL